MRAGAAVSPSGRTRAGTLRLGALLAGLVFTGVFLAGCGGSGPPDSGGSPSASVGTQTASPSAAGSQSGTPTGDILVEYGRQGGIAGFNDRLTVRADGSYTVAHKDGMPRLGRLSATELADLRRVLEASHFTQIPGANPGPGGADLITYRVVYAGHEVLAMDGGIPPALQPVLNALNAILARAG